MTKEKASVELILPNGSIFTKNQEVNSKLVDIMGIDKNQFSQIAMIAQGDFLKLILASTEERKNILRQIFHTENYGKLQLRLKSITSDIQKKYDELQTRISQYISGIIFPENKDNILNIYDTNEIIEELDKIIKSDENDEQILSEKILEKEDLINQNTAILTKAENNEKLKINFKNTELNLEKEKSNLLELEKIFDEAKLKQPEIDNLKKKQALIESELPFYAEIEDKNKKLKLSEEKHKNSEQNYKNIVIQSENCDKTILSIENQLKILDKAGENLISLQNEFEKLNSRKNDLENLISEKNSLIKLKKEYINIKSEYSKAFDLYIEKSRNYENLNSLFLNEQAGILAETLKDNIPCPVCGSLNHPTPAIKSENAPTEAELKISKTEMENANNNASKKSAEAADKKAVYNTKLENFKQNFIKLFNVEFSEQTQEKITEDFSKIQYEIKLLNENIKNELLNSDKKIKLENDLPIQKKLSENLKEKINALNNDLIAVNSDIINLKNNISEISQKLRFSDKKTALSALDNNNLTIKKLENELDFSLNKLNECKNRISLLQGQKEQLKNQINENENMDFDSLQELQHSLKNEKFNLLAKKENIHTRCSSNKKTFENLKIKFKDFEEIKKKLIMVKSLSDTASGNIPKKEKIMLETYIQTAYFDRVIARANTRFMIMSGNQYELKRRVEQDNYRTQSGLDLDVIDHYNGSIRSVKTLSGGESFKASLSLALGLSDEIQSSAGGIQLDTMFVDEGFGSLDENSLQQAIKALLDLSQSNKLVGIISHVSDLKDKIDKQILVKKNSSGGSNAEIII